MSGFFDRVKEAIRRFMAGRYGADSLGWTLFIGALVFNFIGLLAGNTVLLIIAEIVMIYCIFRMMSRNIGKRSLENERFINFNTIVRRGFKTLIKNITDRSYHYYLCPSCHQIVRVPRGRGKVEIHCPKCGTYFTRKS